MSLSPAHLEAYRGIAEAAAAELLGSSERRTALVGCDPASADRTTCLTSFVTRFGARAFRRPLSEAEVSDLVSHAVAAPPLSEPWGAVGYVLETLLQSSSFLFRVEHGEVDAARPGLRRLTGHEVATRLSYLLWGSMPSDALFQAAACGKLATADEVEAQACATS